MRFPFLPSKKPGSRLEKVPVLSSSPWEQRDRTNWKTQLEDSSTFTDSAADVLACFFPVQIAESTVGYRGLEVGPVGGC